MEMGLSLNTSTNYMVLFIFTKKIFKKQFNSLHVTSQMHSCTKREMKTGKKLATC